MSCCGSSEASPVLAVRRCYLWEVKGLFTPLFNDIWGEKKEIEPLTTSIRNAHSALPSVLTSPFFFEWYFKNSNRAFLEGFSAPSSSRLFLRCLPLHLWLIFHYRLREAKLKFSAFPSQGCYQKRQARCCSAQGKTWLTLTQQILHQTQTSDRLYCDVTLVRLMELLLICPEVLPFNRNEPTIRNMVRLKTRQRDCSAAFFQVLLLKLLIWCSILSRISFVALSWVDAVLT